MSITNQARRGAGHDQASHGWTQKRRCVSTLLQHGGRDRSGCWRSAAPGIAIWSAAVQDPALPDQIVAKRLVGVGVAVVDERYTTSGPSFLAVAATAVVIDPLPPNHPHLQVCSPRRCLRRGARPRALSPRLVTPPCLGFGLTIRVVTYSVFHHNEPRCWSHERADRPRHPPVRADQCARPRGGIRHRSALPVRLRLPPESRSRPITGGRCRPCSPPPTSTRYAPRASK